MGEGREREWVAGEERTVIERKKTGRGVGELERREREQRR